MVQGVTDHFLETISYLEKKPAVIGHSFGGLIVQKIADEGASAATVAIDNAPIKGVLPLPASALKSGAPVLGNPANRGRAIALTFEQFKYAWANNLDEAEARQLYDTYHVPASGVPLFQVALANFNPFGGETAVDVKNPQRGPATDHRRDEGQHRADRVHPRHLQTSGEERECHRSTPKSKTAATR